MVENGFLVLGEELSFVTLNLPSVLFLFFNSVFIPSVLTLLVPAACRSSLELGYFIRCMIGFFEGASFPAVYYFFPIWIPLEEKSLMVSSIASGMYFGEMIGISVSGLLIDSSWKVNGKEWGGWQSIFYVFGIAGILWFPFWAFFAYERPEDHPKISREEIELINYGKEGKSSTSSSTYSSVPAVASGRNASQQYSILPELDSAFNPIIGDEENDLEMTVFDLSASGPLRNDSSHSGKQDGEIETEYSEKLISKPTPPWLLFFTHPVCLAFYVNSFTFVRYTPCFSAFNFLILHGCCVVFPFIRFLLLLFSIGFD
jgi:MFS family permease